MKNILSKARFFLLLIFFPMVSTFAVTGGAAPFEPYTLEIPIGETLKITGGLAQYIDVVYRFAVGVAGIVAVAMIVMGGFDWAFAGGAQDKIKKAQERISGALWGMLLILASYVLLNIINPALVSLKGAVIPKIVSGGVEDMSKLKSCTDNYFSSCKECKDTECGKTSSWSGVFCRGTVCASGSACYPDYTASQPSNAYKCYEATMEECGKRGEECLNYDYHYVSYSDCLCGLYNKSECILDTCIFPATCIYETFMTDPGGGAPSGQQTRCVDQSTLSK